MSSHFVQTMEMELEHRVPEVLSTKFTKVTSDLAQKSELEHVWFPQTGLRLKGPPQIYRTIMCRTASKADKYFVFDDQRKEQQQEFPAHGSRSHRACIFHEVVRDEGQCPDSPPELLTHAVTQTHNVLQILIYKTPITLLSVHLLLPSSWPATNPSPSLPVMLHIMGFILRGRKKEDVIKVLNVCVDDLHRTTAEERSSWSSQKPTAPTWCLHVSAGFWMDLYSSSLLPSSGLLENCKQKHQFVRQF